MIKKLEQIPTEKTIDKEMFEDKYSCMNLDMRELIFAINSIDDFYMLSVDSNRDFRFVLLHHNYNLAIKYMEFISRNFEGRLAVKLDIDYQQFQQGDVVAGFSAQYLQGFSRDLILELAVKTLEFKRLLLKEE